MAVDSNVVKFPYNACRRVHSRRPRVSKNGTPEERAAKAVAAATSSVTANVIEISERQTSRAIPTAQELLKEFRTLDEDGQRDISALIDRLIAKRST